MSDQTKFRLNKINKIKDYFNSKTKKKNNEQKLSKCIAALNYIGKILIVLSATSGVVSIISFASVIGAPAGYEVQVTLIFSWTTGIKKNAEHKK